MLLAVTLLAAVIVAAALLEDDYLLALGLGNDLGGDGKAVGGLELRALAGEQDIAQLDGVAGFAGSIATDTFPTRRLSRGRRRNVDTSGLLE